MEKHRTASGDVLYSRDVNYYLLIFGTLNVIGGFLVTDRMLGMFKKKGGK